MPLKITKGSELIKVDNIKMLIYGQPGTGKTSTAFTADDVLLLDCDNGAYRSNFRKDAVEVNSWSDIASIAPADIADYKTIAVDTVGRLLDFLAVDIMQKNPKMGYQGALTLQGYGQLKAQFNTWIKSLMTLSKDVVMIAHDKEEKRGDLTAVRPDIQGGSYSEVFKIADSVGYMYIGDHPAEGELTANVLDFNPTQSWEGKNVAKLQPIRVPKFDITPNFLASVITDIKDAINQHSVQGKMISDLVAKHKSDIDKASTVKALNKELGRYQGSIEDAKPSIKRILFNRSKALGYEYDADKAEFIEPAKSKDVVKSEKDAQDVAGIPENA